ncbi:major facilitator superfamily domain-containing protein [Penicillium bovifimosum]|uniref:Major facilitator superfamily domain-containing protein n=1 Tax=Penicillium bovifimosum TaxID=126998 RepID=A0A9W9L619_9EURO|nr:major facilitator superfamily domain-containing protein [Penicillium bovifimosum]KAJ5138405.1 major facilitator superfamily domain-containing protein [Penicillium bovifimosum]
MPPPSPPPDGGYGWSYGVFLAHYLSDNVFPESTSMDFALIGGLNFSMAMLVAPAVTIIARKYSTRLPMFLGLGFLAAGYVCASFAKQIWHLYLSQGILVGFGVGFIYVPSIPILSQWFDKRRSLANGISAAGSGIGGLIFSFMDGAVIERISLPWALRLTAIISCSVLIVATLLIRNRNEAVRPTQRGFDLKLLYRLDVFLLLSWSFLSMLGYISLLFSLPNYAEAIGLSSNQAAVVNAILNLGTAVGRPLIGVASDRFGRIEVAGLLTCFCGLSCFIIWLPSASYGVLVLFAIISGAILGVFWVTIAPLCVEVAGLEELQSLLSLSWFFIVLPTTFSEVIALKLRRPLSQHPYLYTQVFCGIAYVCASMALLLLWYLRRQKAQITR